MDAETGECASLDEGYRQLSDQWPDRKVELIDDRIVVREAPTTELAKLIYRLLLQLIPVMTERGWEARNGVAIFLGPQLGHYRPDILVVPPDPTLWGNDHVFGHDTLLVVEVVSKSSSRDDHEIKPRGCARGRVPLYLVVDTFAGRVRLLSQPGEKGYARKVEVRLGGPLELPDPWSLTLDTSVLGG